ARRRGGSGHDAAPSRAPVSALRAARSRDRRPAPRAPTRARRTDPPGEEPAVGRGARRRPTGRPFRAAAARGSITLEPMSSASQPATPPPAGQGGTQPERPDQPRASGTGRPQPAGPDHSQLPGQNTPPNAAPTHRDAEASAPVPSGSVPVGPGPDHQLDRALPAVTHEDPADPHASIYQHGFLRAAAITLPVALADPATNAERHLEVLGDLDAQQVGLAVFPELSLTGYSLDDLVLQESLLDAAEQAVLTVLEASRELMPVIVVGAPLRATDRSRIFNCAITLHRGEILGIHPKQNLPTYREFYERRWFAPGDDAHGVGVRLGSEPQHLTPHGLITVEDLPGLSLFVEICEDM